VKDAISLIEHMVDIEGQRLEEYDGSRLASQHALASAYLDDGQVKEAITIFEHVVSMRRQTLVEDDQSRLASEHALAQALRAHIPVKIHTIA